MKTIRIKLLLSDGREAGYIDVPAPKGTVDVGIVKTSKSGVLLVAALNESHTNCPILPITFAVELI